MRIWRRLIITQTIKCLAKESASVTCFFRPKRIMLFSGSTLVPPWWLLCLNSLAMSLSSSEEYCLSRSLSRSLLLLLEFPLPLLLYCRWSPLRLKIKGLVSWPYSLEFFHSRIYFPFTQLKVIYFFPQTHYRIFSRPSINNLLGNLYAFMRAFIYNTM